MRKMYYFCIPLVLTSCQPARPEQENFYIYRSDAHPSDTDELVSAISSDGVLRVEKATYNLNDNPRKNLRVFNVVTKEFSTFVQENNNECFNLKGPHYLFINVARWKSGETQTLIGVSQGVKKSARRLNWMVVRKPTC